MPDSAEPRIAIVGSGPAGCYLAQALLRTLPGSDITIFDRLASPFGLIRYGVAADHQHTKAIARQFERLFESPAVRFAGNIEVGRDLTLDALRSQFDVVALATGLSVDRPLDLPGGHLSGVVGAGTLIRMLNSFPGSGEFPTLGSDVVVVGAGNVALDILRFLVKDLSGYVGSDVSDRHLSRYLEEPTSRITVASRSDAPHSKGDAQMLKEIAALHRASYSTPDPIDAPDGTELDRVEAARVAAFAELVSAERGPFPGPEVTLRFGVVPTRVMGEDRVTAVEYSDGTDTFTVPATSVITAIGFRTSGENAIDELVAEASDTGRVEPGLYRTGWAMHGPRGGIPENRAFAKSVADEIAADLAPGDALGFAGLPPEVRERAIDYRQWQTLDALECASAEPDRVRRKIPDHDRMVEIARGDQRTL